MGRAAAHENHALGEKTHPPGLLTIMFNRDKWLVMSLHDTFYVITILFKVPVLRTYWPGKSG